MVVLVIDLKIKNNLAQLLTNDVVEQSEGYKKSPPEKAFENLTPVLPGRSQIRKNSLKDFIVCINIILCEAGITGSCCSSKD